jgi:hypothetical protein
MGNENDEVKALWKKLIAETALLENKVIDLAIDLKKLNKLPASGEREWDITIVRGQIAKFTKQLDVINKEIEKLEDKTAQKRVVPQPIQEKKDNRDKTAKIKQ